MSRKLRFQYPGGLYHVINRGNYRSWIFKKDEAKISFEKTLFETCDKFGWILHACAIMGNHFHLALETPQPNLSEGMRWLQCVFATRFIRYRKERGHIFQGRFKSIVVEDKQRLGWLCHYIHLNPVRAKVCNLEDLKEYPYNSYRFLWKKRGRPDFLTVETFLESAGSLGDSYHGRRKYAQYLGRLAEDLSARRSLNFERMSKGWVHGTKEFKLALLEDEKDILDGTKPGPEHAREIRELVGAKRLKQCLKILGKDKKHLRSEPKSVDWKVAIAGVLKNSLSCPNAWVGQNLAMGSEYGVSRYVSEMNKGDRKKAAKIYRQLTAKITD